MMDELELLKKDWQKKEVNLPKLSYNEIYKMTWKKSSSIVKWMYYISVIELLFWIVLSIFPFFMESFQENLNRAYGSSDSKFIMVTTVFSLTIVLVFIYFLFKAYRAISVVDNIKSLMTQILRTRKIINYYVIYNLIMAVLITAYSFYILFTTDEKTINLLKSVRENDSELQFWAICSLIVLLGIGFMVGFIWLFYKLIYGFLLKRLNDNYKELQRLEI